MAIGINADYGMEDISVKVDDEKTVVVKCDVLEMAADLCKAYNRYVEMDPPKEQQQETDLLNEVFVKYGLPSLKSAAADRLAMDIVKAGVDRKNEHRAILDLSSDAESPDTLVG